jgi:hypothetical protein
MNIHLSEFMGITQRVALALVLSGSVACGTSSDPTIYGDWTGQLKQSSGLTCSDGTFIGAGLNTKTRSVLVSVHEAPVGSAGAPGTVTVQECVFLAVSESGTSAQRRV